MKKISESQKKAICHGSGAALVLAGAGSGKTTVITHRIKKLIDNGVPPQNILVVTFTRAAAANMNDRFRKLAENQTLPVLFGTFHSIYFRILRTEQKLAGNCILKETEKINIIKEIVVRNKLSVTSLNDFAANILDEICRMKGNKYNVQEYKPTNCSQETFMLVYTQYEKEKSAENKMDFEDILIRCYELFKDNPHILHKWQEIFQYILIDEFQDINALQYEIIKLLGKPYNNIFVVGDDDQSIYGFRGARPDIMFQFRDDYVPQQYILNINYRSGNAIVESANKLIRNNNNRFPKDICAATEEYHKIETLMFKNQKEEFAYVGKKIQQYVKDGIRLKEMAILVRNNSQTMPILTVLQNQGIRSRAAKQKNTVYDGMIAKDILAYIIASQNWDKLNFRENEELFWVLNKPYRMISRQIMQDKKMTIKKLKEIYCHSSRILEEIESLEFHMEMIKKLSPYGAVNYIKNAVNYEKYLTQYAKDNKIKLNDLLDRLDEIQSDASRYETLEQWIDSIKNTSCKTNSGDSVAVMTMHGAKGLEFRVVFVVDVNQGIVPSSRALRERDFEEERRVFYVAMTRAKERLHIYCVKEILGCSSKQSMFIDEIL